MIFAPHILQVKVITPMEKDEFGRPIPGTGDESWQDVRAVVMITQPKSFHPIMALCIVLTIMWCVRRESPLRQVMQSAAWTVKI